GTGYLSSSIFPASSKTQAKIYAKEEGIVCGLEITKEVFLTIDPELEIALLYQDGEPVERGQVVMKIKGRINSILKGERVALNFLQHLSGVATATNQLVRECEGLPTKITDTRKTLPGLRMLQKYAVRMGGGQNHRFGLYDGVMLKDNHIAAAGGIKAAVEAARKNIGHMVKIEVECESLEQVKEALEAGADVIMLDNMDLEEMSQAVKMVNGKAILEASGGIKKGAVKEIAQTGVDVISVGAITHSVKALDFSLDLGEIKETTLKRWKKEG
ncbi:MAG: carboxylating nicotinate-nucleotide diphosphorylase, partial [Desulfitobacterium sp.]|nr:carboxylating nicotinate-nucleotide diphosphorylase [Desulfitobacterium sp.]